MCTAARGLCSASRGRTRPRAAHPIPGRTRRQVGEPQVGEPQVALAPSRPAPSRAGPKSAGPGRRAPGRLAPSRAGRIIGYCRLADRHLRGVGVRFDLVAAVGWGGPAEDAWMWLFEAPAGQLLDLVVCPAAAAQVAAAGRPAAMPGDGVVDVGAPGGLAAGVEPAGFVPGGDELPQPGRGPVRRRCPGMRAGSSGIIKLSFRTGAAGGSAGSAQRHDSDGGNGRRACRRGSTERAEPAFPDGDGNPADCCGAAVRAAGPCRRRSPGRPRPGCGRGRCCLWRCCPAQAAGPGRASRGCRVGRLWRGRRHRSR